MLRVQLQEHKAAKIENIEITHLSPGVSLIYDLAYDSGMLQSDLFTSKNQNLVFAILLSVLGHCNLQCLLSL